ncbi:MAG: hypothetical protein AB1521_10780 [Bacteroidota bacterium]
MNIPLIIVATSTLIWLLPPFRQYRTYYFGYFLILAISDPVKIFFLNSFSIPPQIISPFFSMMLVSSVIKMQKRLVVFVLSFLLLLILLAFNIESKLILLINASLHVWILMLIVSKLIDAVVETKALNLFLILLVVYEFMAILKNLVVVFDLTHGTAQFYVTTIVQIIFGLVFTFINYNNSKFFPIKNYLVRE